MLRELGNSNAIDQALAGMIEDGNVTVDITGTAHKHFLRGLGDEAYR